VDEPSVITAIFAGAGGLVIAISKLNGDTVRRRKFQIEYQEALLNTQENLIQDLEIQVVDCERHIFSMEQILARAGMDVPKRPVSLSANFPKAKRKEVE